MPTSHTASFDSPSVPAVPTRTLAAARSLAGRVRLVRTLAAGALGFAIGSAVAASLLVASTRLPEWHTIAPWIGGGIALLGLFAGGVIGWRRAVPDTVGAGRADAALGLHDRLTTAVELSEELNGQTSDRPRPFAGVLYAEAESAAASIRPGRIVPLRFDRAWAVGTACLALGAIGWIFLPVRTPPPRGPLAGATPESIQEADDAIRETIESLERNPAEDESLVGAGRDGEPDGVADELSAIRERLERGEVRPEDALAEAANELERAAARAEEEAADPASDAIADAARESAEDLSPESTELAEALASGDLERARDAARDLMRNAEGMPPEARERIAEDLARLADAIDASSPENPASPDRPSPSDELTEALREKAGDLTDEQRVADALENEGVDPTSARELAEQIAREERDRARRERAREDAERLRDALKDASRDLSDRPEPEAPADSSSEEPDQNLNEPQRETGRDETSRDPTEQPGDKNTLRSEEQPGTDEQPGRDDQTGSESPVDAPRDPTDQSPEKRSGEEGTGEQEADEQGTGEKRADEQGQPQPTEGAGDQQTERPGEGDAQTPQERQPGEQPSDQPADQPGEQSGEQPGEQSGETQRQDPEQQPGQQEVEQSSEQQGQRPGEQSGEQPGQQEGEQQGQQSGQESGQRGEQAGQEPGEQAGDQAGDRAEGQPVDGEPRGEGEPGQLERPADRPADQDATGETEPTRDGGEGAGNGRREDQRGLDRLSEELDRLAESQKERRARRQESEDMRRRAQELLDKATPEERERLQDLAEEFAERNPDRVPPSGQRPGAPYDVGSETVDARDPDNADPTGPEQTLSEWFNPEGEPVDGVDRSARTPEALRDAAESAERAVEQQRVPPRYRRLVREVFKNMRERADAEQRGAPAELGEDASKSGSGGSGSQNDSSKKDSD